ncbi:hypothetical protein ACXR2W_02300 [Leucobacter sp. HY1908]
MNFVQVAPRLLLGAAPTNLDGRSQQQQAEAIARRQVGLVVDCRAGADDAKLWSGLRVDYLSIGVEDSGEPLPRWFFTNGVEAVLEHWASDTTSVFAHCEFGHARSPALALAILLAEGIPEAQAVQTILSKRQDATRRYFPSALRWFRWFSEEPETSRK